MTSPARHPPHALGSWGEAIACALLLRTGWRILERSYRLGRREVDIIARRGRTLAFVEVKTRSGLGFGAPEDAVTSRKRREIETVARDYLMRHVRDDVDVRFDVIAVMEGAGRRVLRCEHLEDAWRPS
jgi:putative endonuclease